MNKFVLSCLSIALLSSCANQVYQFEDERYRYQETDMDHFFFIGLGQSDETDALAICEEEQDIVKIETAQKPLSALLGILFAPIYTPKDVTVYCKK